MLWELLHAGDYCTTCHHMNPDLILVNEKVIFKIWVVDFMSCVLYVAFFQKTSSPLSHAETLLHLIATTFSCDTEIPLRLFQPRSLQIYWDSLKVMKNANNTSSTPMIPCFFNTSAGSVFIHASRRGFVGQAPETAAQGKRSETQTLSSHSTICQTWPLTSTQVSFISSKIQLKCV